MRIQATKQEPRLDQLLPEDTKEFIIQRTEEELKEAEQAILDADAEVKAAAAELKDRLKARFRGVEGMSGARPGVGSVGEDTSLQDAVYAAGVRLATAKLNAQLTRSRKRDLDLRLKYARRGVTPVLVHIIESRAKRITFGGAKKVDMSQADWEYAQALRKRKRFEAQEHERQLREAGMVRG